MSVVTWWSGHVPSSRASAGAQGWDLGAESKSKGRERRTALGQAGKCVTASEVRSRRPTAALDDRCVPAPSV